MTGALKSHRLIYICPELYELVAPNTLLNGGACFYQLAIISVADDKTISKGHPITYREGLQHICESFQYLNRIRIIIFRKIAANIKYITQVVAWCQRYTAQGLPARS